MENVGTGHWIFAGVFMVVFIGYLVWSYRKDLKLHRIHYQRSSYVLIGLVVILFLIFIFKRLL